MNPEKTAPFELGEGDDACLLLHGFTGSPWDMRPLGEALAAQGMKVKAICLPGHGQTPSAMERVTFLDWERAADEALLSLSSARRCFVAGLSVGALLGTLLAARRPRYVQGLALIAPALTFLGPQLVAARRLRRLPLLPWLRPWVDKTSTDIEDPVARAEAPVLASFPSARLYDVWTLQDKVRRELGQVRAPTLIAVAAQDHVVSEKGARELARGLVAARPVRFIRIERGYHIIPRDFGGALLADEVGHFFAGISGARAAIG